MFVVKQPRYIAIFNKNTNMGSFVVTRPTNHGRQLLRAELEKGNETFIVVIVTKSPESVFYCHAL